MASAVLRRFKCTVVIFCRKNFTGQIVMKQTYTSRTAHSLIASHLCLRNGYDGCYLSFLRRSSQSVHHHNLISVLQKCTSLQDQLEKMYETLSLTAEDFENRMEICKNIQNVLKPFFPNCSIHLIGSSANGLGAKGSDVDMTFMTGYSSDEVTNSQYAHVPSIEDVKNGKFELKALCCIPVKAQLLFIKEVLEKDCPECVNVEYVSGRCRIVSFLYQKYNLSCDLSSSNRTGFYSTKLLHFYGKLDKRVPMLLTFLKYWAKRCRLVGGPFKFKTYALSLLMIYFLQTRSPSVVPTVEHIFSKSDFFTSDAPWDYGESPDLGKIEPSRNTQSAEDLLREFFFFYAFFDFYNVVRPLSGTTIHQSLLTFRKDQEGGLNTNDICIEDPLDVSWNVTCYLQCKIARAFVENITAVCKLYQGETFLPCESGNWGLMEILDRDRVSDSSFIYGPVSIQIPSTFEGAHHSEKEFKDHWLQRVSQAVLKTLEHGFLIRCTVLNTKNQLCFQNLSARRKLRKRIRASVPFQTTSCDVDGMQDSVKSQNNDHVILHLYCVAKDIWQGRDEYRKQLYSTNSIPENLLEREHFVSSRLHEQKQKNFDKREFHFLCECSEAVHNERTVLNITLKPAESKAFLPKLAILLKEHVPSIVNYLV